ncbi:hypothetical protein [Sulfurospirillum cavolei]|uniref:hypothetical protein n=1 Tax=Sulfurospirillum cavolei TaxID=366522 RepID=UPI003FA1E012
MSKAKNSLGASIFIETSTAGTFVKVGELLDIPGMLGDKTGRIDVTNMDSEDYKEYISDGLKDATEFTLECNCIPNDPGQMRVFELGSSNANTKIKLELNDQITPTTGNKTTVIRDGYIPGIPNIVPAKGSQTKFSFSFQPSGAPDVTMAS